MPSWLSSVPESTTPKLSPKPPNGQPPAKPTDESLSDQEKNLLQQLQDELARREQEESGQSNIHLVDDRHEPPHVYDWQHPGGPSIMLNGVPPQQQGDQLR